MADRLTDAELDEIDESSRQWASPLTIKCPSCGNGPGDRCYGNGSMARPHDARREAARQRVIDNQPRLLAEVKALREEVRNLSEALGFGNGITEPAATLPALIDPLQDALHDATEHAECPIWCALCGERLADTRCKHCQGSGCGTGTASGAYEECEWCAGAGKIHPGCIEMSYADMAAAIRKYEEEGKEL